VRTGADQGSTRSLFSDAQHRCDSSRRWRVTEEQRPSEGRRDEAGRLGAGADPNLWEVFRQEKDGDPMRHAGNVRAPDRELALDYAREFYSRRNESIRLWVVPRTEISDLTDPDLLQPPLDRSFKKPGGYVMRDKLEVAKKRAAKGAGE
jgi:ring-1,2-phenylacetyl-CoA epoxidase subunit PaaB